MNVILNDIIVTTKAKCGTRNTTLTEMLGVKLQKKLDFMQIGVYKCRYEKLDVHLQWQKIEELGQVFLLQKCTF